MPRKNWIGKTDIVAKEIDGIKIPMGWKIVTYGRTKEGDAYWAGEWKDCGTGRLIKEYSYVIRRIK